MGLIGLITRSGKDEGKTIGKAREKVRDKVTLHLPAGGHPARRGARHTATSWVGTLPGVTTPCWEQWVARRISVHRCRINPE